MSATACVSAAEPERQHQIVSCTCVSLSVTRFAMYAPVVVRLSAPSITPSLKLIAMLFAVRHRMGFVWGRHTWTCRDWEKQLAYARILRQTMSYLTSPFFRWFMSTWMPSTKGELQSGVWELVAYLLQAYPWPLWISEKCR